MVIRYKSQVNATPAAHSADAVRFFSAKLGYETDPADVHFDMQHGVDDFVLVDVRSEADYAEEHIVGAINIPHQHITEARIAAAYPEGTLFISYCWGPACNGSTKGAIRFSTLGYPVKEMIGGIEYWKHEGYATEST